MEEALQVARQIAEALEAAHEKVVTHRDLKQGNISITRNGVKVLNFGAGEPHVGAHAQRFSRQYIETVAEPITRAGAILGTLY